MAGLQIFRRFRLPPSSYGRATMEDKSFHLPLPTSPRLPFSYVGQDAPLRCPPLSASSRGRGKAALHNGPIRVNLRASAVRIVGSFLRLLCLFAGDSDHARFEPIEIAAQNSLCHPVAAPINIVSSAVEQALDT